MDDSRKMEVISQLMDELQEMMHPSSDELGERLGRPKSVEVMKMGVDGQPGPMEGDMGDEGSEDEMGEDDDMNSPDEMLKRRLMKLRE